MQQQYHNDLIRFLIVANLLLILIAWSRLPPVTKSVLAGFVEGVVIARFLKNRDDG